MEKVFIIAEAGVNHNGSLETALKMIDKAKEAGVDAIKFQSFKTASLVTRNAQKADYQVKNTATTDTQFEMLKSLEMSVEMHHALFNYAKERGILFLSSPFDLESIDLLNSMGMEIMKIPSGEISNLPYLRRIGRLGKRVILSTGMAEMKEIEEAVSVLLKSGATEITVLHCNTEYPTPMQDVNLKAMCSIRDRLNVKIGYSDHTLGIEVPIAAVALGACVIEKHFTLDKTMPGPDHKASLDPAELAEMTRCIRNIEAALGDGEKKPSNSEAKNISVVRKSIVAATAIKKGEALTERNLTTKRPGTGISPMRWDELIGQPAKRDFKEDEMIEL